MENEKETNLEFEAEAEGVEKTEEIASEESIAEPEVEAEQVEEVFELASNVRDVIRNRIAEEFYEAPWGKERRYWFIDYDSENGMVYVNDESDHKLYGVPYVTNGDNIDIDFACKKRMKWAIVEFNEGEEDNIDPMQELFEHKDSVCNDVFSKANEANEQLDELKSELESLRQFKLEVDAKNISNLLATFSYLEGIEDFDKLVENHSGMTVVEIENACYAIKGRNDVVKSYSHAESGMVRTLVDTAPMAFSLSKDKEEPYGGLVEKYTK